MMGPTIAKKGNFDGLHSHLKNYFEIKFPFLAIVGLIIAYIIHQISKKGKFIPKWFLDQLYLPSKNSFFGNCGSHYRLYKPSKLPKEEILFQNGFEILIPAIKIAFLVIVGP